MPSSNNADPAELVHYVLWSLQVCDRLEAWAAKPTKSPLVVLAQVHVKNLAATARCYFQKIEPHKLHTAAYRQGADLVYNLPTQFFEILSSCKQLILEGLSLMQFSCDVQLHGDEGALNKVFASTFILNEGCLALDDIRHIVEKRNRVIQTAHDVRSCRFGPVIGTFLHNLKSDYLSLANSTFAQFSPGYVHKYAVSSDQPYLVATPPLAFAGGFGLIQKVTHRRTDEVFAQKTIKRIFDESDRKKVLRELRVLEVCHHRNIVALVEAYEIDNDPHSINIVMMPWAPYTLMDFLKSPDTSRRASCPWFEPNQSESDLSIYRMIGGLANGVGYLHGLSIKHKDIKPDNILLYQEHSSDLVPLLTDVGVSKVYRRGATTDYTGSTYTFLALEQLERWESTLKADIWQLGCCFALLLAVLRGGTKALNRLWHSFDWTCGDCSSNIAREHESFMTTFKDICLPGSALQERSFTVVCGMLELNPADRLDIEAVKEELREFTKGD